MRVRNALGENSSWTQHHFSLHILSRPSNQLVIFHVNPSMDANMYRLIGCISRQEDEVLLQHLNGTGAEYKTLSLTVADYCRLLLPSVKQANRRDLPDVPANDADIWEVVALVSKFRSSHPIQDTRPNLHQTRLDQYTRPSLTNGSRVGNRRSAPTPRLPTRQQQPSRLKSVSRSVTQREASLDLEILDGPPEPNPVLNNNHCDNVEDPTSYEPRDALSVTRSSTVREPRTALSDRFVPASHIIRPSNYSPRNSHSKKRKRSRPPLQSSPTARQRTNHNNRKQWPPRSVADVAPQNNRYYQQLSHPLPPRPPQPPRTATQCEDSRGKYTQSRSSPPHHSRASSDYSSLSQKTSQDSKEEDEDEYGPDPFTASQVASFP